MKKRTCEVYLHLQQLKLGTAVNTAHEVHVTSNWGLASDRTELDALDHWCVKSDSVTTICTHYQSGLGCGGAISRTRVGDIETDHTETTFFPFLLGAIFGLDKVVEFGSAGVLGRLVLLASLDYE